MTLNILPNLREKLEKLQCVVFDVDGTLTDGGIYMNEDRELMKRFCVKDGMGMQLLLRAGLTVVWVTARNSDIVRKRAENLGISKVAIGVGDKQNFVEQISRDWNFPLEQIAYMGDDVNDLPAMRVVGVSACPADAAEPARNVADFVATNAGGYGAARQFCDLILLAKGIEVERLLVNISAVVG